MRIRTKPSPDECEPLQWPSPYHNRSGDFAEPDALKKANDFVDGPITRFANWPEVLPLVRFQDELTPGFLKKLKDGDFLPINPMSAAQTPQPKINVGAELRAVYDAGLSGGRIRAFRGFNSMAVTVPHPKAIATSADINEIQIDALARLKAGTMDYATSLVEMRQTIAMFTSFRGNLMTRIERVAEAWRLRNRGKKFASEKKAWESFSQFWLEYRFGWRILYYDLKTLYEFANRDEGTPILTFGQRRTFSKKENRSLFRIGNRNCGVDVGYSLEYEEVVSAGYSARVDLASLGNPVALNTLWEVLPWTLVIDMFLNVQSNILAFSSFPIGIDRIPGSGYLTRKSTVKMEIQVIPFQPPSSMRFDLITKQTGTGNNFSRTRKKVGDPDFSIRFRPNLSPGKVLDLLTLILPASRAVKSLVK